MIHTVPRRSTIRPRIISRLGFSGESRPLGIAKADHANVFKQLPLAEEDELAAVATLRDPGNQLFYGFIPETQPSGSVAGAQQYNCVSRVIVSLACP